MKITKKLFALLLAVVLAFSVFAVAASAAGTASGDEWMTVTVTTDKGVNTCETRETVVVTVSIACNYNVPTFRFPVLFDKSVLQTKVLLGQQALGTCATSGTLSYNKITDGSCIPENYDADQWGCVLFQWVGNTAGSVGCINNPDGEAVFSFELETTTSSAGKTGTIFIPSESDLLYYMAFEDPEVATSYYFMTPETCEMSFVPANVSVAAADVKLIPNADYASGAIIDEDRLYVYGFNLPINGTPDVKENVSATGGATIRVTPTDLGYGTGSLIELKFEGVTVKTYTMIIYGDSNGDVDVTATDVSTALGIFLSTVSVEPYVNIALDISSGSGGCDGTVDTFDCVALMGAQLDTYVIDQAQIPVA